MIYRMYASPLRHPYSSPSFQVTSLIKQTQEEQSLNKFLIAKVQILFYFALFYFLY